ncbi:hypothetical protein K431DRAFT_216918 [Polychaeton citri CBS 116435]|uniref:Raptor N-terminal CASPase-like domain-containing protein n=1 Tax=Polychaeton citri CBS 116435 TaxID=1314669 RepID=A0A9P4QE34_9PEZI|nr:hypothetical protein K431DRAFT_216918 [Polychaeton citri CBS 116435]
MQQVGARLRPSGLSRGSSYFSNGTRIGLDPKDGEPDGERMRHGWDHQLKNSDQAHALSQTFFMYFEDKRHETAGNPPLSFEPAKLVGDWRMRDRLKTVSAVLAVCLNVGVDPPDVIKTSPCARLECWVDPIPPDSAGQASTNNSNAQIGKNLQNQYENLSLRTRYKVILDPTIEELKKYTQSLRRTAHAERILFHYNGHGVPKPTPSGEIWCFNKNYTQYIPISLFELMEWVGAPGLWVWDCSSAGGIITNFLDSASKHEHHQEETLKKDPLRAAQPDPRQGFVRWEDCIHLAACRENEVLPTNPSLPADIFTSCLTTPIMMAVRFFILQNPLDQASAAALAQARNIPGKVSERRTPLGELNWIFTAITDTIAWNCLEKPLFKKLFRQDLMVAALFRNFLLAQRIMRIYHCHPQSWPRIPDTHDHPLWRSWDLAVEMILAQLPSLIVQQKANEATEAERNTNGAPGQANGSHQPPHPSLELEYQHSDFFADQLSAFEVYLASAPAQAMSSDYDKRVQPPEQLPIVLQVLLSQVHRLRALILLSKFLDLGPWAVNLALSIGIFPYVLKLLQSQAIELKPPMVFIWARILAVDSSCQGDLLKDQGFQYFTTILTNSSGIPLGNIAEHRAMCAFVVAVFVKGFPHGKRAVFETSDNIIEHLLKHLLDMENPLLRQFSCLCLAYLWEDYPDAKKAGFERQAHSRICDRSHDPVPEVRAAALHALTTFMACGPVEPALNLEEETIAAVVISMGMDGSIMVRKELVVFYSTFVKRYHGRFIIAAYDQLQEERDKKAGESADGPLQSAQVDGAYEAPPATKQIVVQDYSSTKQQSRGTIYRAVWRQILSMSADPHPEVAQNAAVVCDFVINALLESPLASHANEVLDEIEDMSAKADGDIGMPPITRQNSNPSTRPGTPPSPALSTSSKVDGYFGLPRNASVGQALKNLFFRPKTPAEEAPLSPTNRSHRGSVTREINRYRSRPLTPEDAALFPPDALDKVAGPPHQPKAKIPYPPCFLPRDFTKLPELPLKSSFFTWSSSYFREPQMRPSESDEPGSREYNERLWRRNRNDRIIATTQPLKEAAGSQGWDVPSGHFGIGAAPTKITFHQFENHLVSSDDRDSIAVWDWMTDRSAGQEPTQLNRFSNGNPDGSRITELRFINEDDQAMLMTGSSDGVIKIYRNYYSKENVELASSFRALSDLITSDKQNAGLVFDWQQGQGRVLVAGDDRVIRVWQAGHELCIMDIPARSGSCITSLTSDQVEGNVFVAGFGNGGVRAYDQRIAPQEAMVACWTNRKEHHRSWIVGVHLQRGGTRELVSAESNGGVRLWDLRNTSHAVNAISSRKESPRSLRALSVHEHAPVFATGGADHTIRVYNSHSLEQLSKFEPYMSYMRWAPSRKDIAPITATAFHPHRMLLACGAVNDGHVNLFGCEARADVNGALKATRDAIVTEWQG